MPNKNLGNINNTSVNRITNRIIENMLGLISQVSLEGTYEYLSPSHKALLGYEPQVLLHKSPFDFIHPDDVAMVKDSFVQGLTTGQYKQTKYRYRCADGKYMYLESQGSVIFDENNQVYGAVFLTRDISNRVEMEFELARLGQLKMVGELAAGLAHEIRNPITTVRGFLQVLGEYEELDKYRNYFDLMIEELDGANKLISEFLSMAKNKEANFSQQNLNTIIQSIYPILAADASLSDKTIELELGSVNDIYMDANQIRQLILNLANNGLESMAAGGCLTIRTVAIRENIVLSVEDHGHGINADTLEKIGTPFFTTKEQGTGLGLAICNNIADNHKAQIEIISSEKGTTFSVVFNNSGAMQETNCAIGYKNDRCVS